MNEAQTEFEYIDPALKAAGWGVVEGSQVRKQWPISQGRLLGQGRRSKPLKTDNVLCYKNRNIVLILEMKFIKVADPEIPRGGYEPIWA